MRQGLGLAFGMALAALAAGSIGAGAQAQQQQQRAAQPVGPKIGCPKAGTVVERIEGNLNITTTYRGSDPADPAMCLAETFGQQQRILYGIFLQNNTTGRLSARNRIDQLFTGQVKEISFTASLPTANQGVSLFSERWRRLDPEAILLNGRTIRAQVFQRTVNGQAGNAFSARFTYYYDPETSVWVKRNETVWRGDPEPMVVTKITVP
jgi:hypothetical protein